jgi:ABC-type oligopeptide transport system substrate-binding subunit
MVQLRATALLAFALLAGACDLGGGATDSADAVRIAFVTDEGISLDEGSRRDAAVVRATQTGLTAFEPGGRVVPSLAISWRVSDDGLTYIFKLREAYWTDGRRMTAGDVVAVLRRIVAPGSRSVLRRQLMMIENAAPVAANRKPVRMLGVDDPRPDTVVIRLTRAEPALLQLLADPSAAIARAGDTPAASGPFERVDDEADGSVRLVRNGSHFAADAVTLNGAELSELDAAAAVERFAAGALDIVTGGRLAGLRLARGAESGAMHLEPTWGVYYYLARTSAGPLADVRVRRALAMSVDRAGILARMFNLPGLQPAYGALPPTLPDAYAGSAAEWAQWTAEARQAEAARLMTEAGYGLDNPLVLRVAIPHGREHTDLLEAMTAYWGAIGVRVKAYARGPLPHRQTIAKGDYDLALVEHIAPAPVADIFLDPFTCANRLGGYCNPAVDALLEQAASEDDPGTRIQLQRRANRLIAEDAPLIAVLSPLRWSLVAPRVTGWQDNIAGAHPLWALSIAGSDKEN